MMRPAVRRRRRGWGHSSSLPPPAGEATAIAQVQAQVCQRLLRVFVRRGLLPRDAAQAMAQWPHMAAAFPSMRRCARRGR